jgi:hypothetical protein
MPSQDDLGPCVRLIDVGAKKGSPGSAVALTQLVPVRGAHARLVVKDVDAACACAINRPIRKGIGLVLGSRREYRDGRKKDEDRGKDKDLHIFQQRLSLGIISRLHHLCIVEICAAQLRPTRKELEPVPVESVFSFVTRHVVDDCWLGDHGTFVLDRFAVIFRENNGKRVNLLALSCIRMYVEEAGENMKSR